MKKIVLNKRQITEVLNVAVDVSKGDVKTSLQNAKTETDKQVGQSAERNYVIPGEELTEDKTFTVKEVKEAKTKTLLNTNKVYTKEQLKELFNKRK